MRMLQAGRPHSLAHMKPWLRLTPAAQRALRRVLHVYWRLTRGLTLGVRAVVLDGEGRVFLVRHSYIAGWHLPGGGVEPGETSLSALARELREEGNITLTGPPVFHGLFFNARVSRRDHVAVFVVRAVRQEGPPRPNREIRSAGFFHPASLPPDTTAGTRRRIAEVLGGTTPAAEW
jgi:8-oxo-dGTP pyrophosphatase MutT (NUDIX family)